MENASPSLRTILGGASRAASQVGSSRLPEENEESEYEAFASGRVGNKPQLTLLFRKASGEVFGFPYASFTEIRSENADLGFTVEFSGVEVEVQGQNLSKLFRYVCFHRAAEIVEAARSEQFTLDPKLPVVLKINRKALV